jgi:hypothetical protein
LSATVRPKEPVTAVGEASMTMEKLRKSIALSNSPPLAEGLRVWNATPILAARRFGTRKKG